MPNEALARQCAEEQFPLDVKHYRDCNGRPWDYDTNKEGRDLCLAAILSYEKERQGVRADYIPRLRDFIEKRIDHYQPYRPILDSEVATKVREELNLILRALPEPPKEEGNG